MRRPELHWPEYLIEACCLAFFMLSAVAFAVLFQHPPSLLASLAVVFTDPSGVGERLPLVLVGPTMSSSTRLARRTGAAAAVLVTAFIAIEAPFSGMSMNPARTPASAAFGGAGDLMIYLVAPPLGMLGCAELFVRLGAACHVLCAERHHGGVSHSGSRCIFHCGHPEATT